VGKKIIVIRGDVRADFDGEVKARSRSTTRKDAEDLKGWGLETGERETICWSFSHYSPRGRRKTHLTNCMSRGSQLKTYISEEKEPPPLQAGLGGRRPWESGGTEREAPVKAGCVDPCRE